MTTITYRAPSASDIDEVARVHVRCWQEAYAGLMDAAFLAALSVEQRKAQWQRSINDPAVFKQLACDGARIVGFVSSGPMRETQHADGEIYAIYVLASHHRKGIGRSLFDAAVADWQARGGQSLAINVFTANAPAIAFYEAMGCKKVADVICKIADFDMPESVYVLDATRRG
jgi:ribosomal protein S18 acetylase RimI-like enzyme